MKPSEAVASAVQHAHAQEPNITALSFEQFVSMMATTINGLPRNPTDSEAFHVSVLATLRKDFIASAFQLKALAYGFAEADVESNVRLLASDGPWIAHLDDTGRGIYRRMNELYRCAVHRVAIELEKSGWVIDDTELQ